MPKISPTSRCVPDGCVGTCLGNSADGYSSPFWFKPINPTANISYGGLHKTFSPRARTRRWHWFPVLACVVTFVASPSRVSAQGGVELSYLGNAGWQITDGKTVVLVDPYLTRAKLQTPNDPARSDDPRPLLSFNDFAVPDTAVIDAHIRKADFILVTHTHPDHVLDVPYIARKTGARVIGTQSTINYARDCGVPGAQLVDVKGGEVLRFGPLTIRVIPSLHGILRHAPDLPRGSALSSAAVFPSGVHPPFRFRDFVEGGTLAYLVRLGGVQVIAFGSMNFIEGDLKGLRPDVALIGAMPERHEIDHYTSRLLRVLGDPPLVLPTHWDAFNVPYGMSQQPAIARLQSFFAEVKAASPHSRTFVPEYFQPIRVMPRHSATHPQ
jgi:L-ascorbate metabolism protein UlaG (beta-lactamase superfamily)